MKIDHASKCLGMTDGPRKNPMKDTVDVLHICAFILPGRFHLQAYQYHRNVLFP
jgi:hypothetical protein